MLILPETRDEKRSRVLKVSIVVVFVIAFTGSQLISRYASGVSQPCEMQMQNASAVSSCNASNYCLVTTEQGITFWAQSPKMDELIPVKVCK